MKDYATLNPEAMLEILRESLEHPHYHEHGMGGPRWRLAVTNLLMRLEPFAVAKVSPSGKPMPVPVIIPLNTPSTPLPMWPGGEPLDAPTPARPPLCDKVYRDSKPACPLQIGHAGRCSRPENHEEAETIRAAMIDMTWRLGRLQARLDSREPVARPAERENSGGRY